MRTIDEVLKAFPAKPAPTTLEAFIQEWKDLLKKGLNESRNTKQNRQL